MLYGRSRIFVNKCKLTLLRSKKAPRLASLAVFFVCVYFVGYFAKSEKFTFRVNFGPIGPKVTGAHKPFDETIKRLLD
jgi:hypothetical protein